MNQNIQQQESNNLYTPQTNYLPHNEQRNETLMWGPSNLNINYKQIDPELLKFYLDINPKLETLNLEQHFYPADYMNNNHIQIDPEILNLYTQINPKLALQPDIMNALNQPELANIHTVNQIIHGPVNLTCSEIPNLGSDFFLHLISMFFAYFHTTFPILDEKRNHRLVNYSISSKSDTYQSPSAYASKCYIRNRMLLFKKPFVISIAFQLSSKRNTIFHEQGYAGYTSPGECGVSVVRFN